MWPFSIDKKRETLPKIQKPILEDHIVNNIIVNIVSCIDPDGKPESMITVDGNTLTILVTGEKILENLAYNMNFTLQRCYKNQVEDRMREEISYDIRHPRIKQFHYLNTPPTVFVP